MSACSIGRACGASICVTLCFVVMPACVTATEIVGQIESIDQLKAVIVVVVGEFDPQPGDKFRVMVDVPGVGSAQVAAGQVKETGGGRVVGTVGESTGKIAPGQKVMIDSPNAVKRVVLPPSAGGLFASWGLSLRDVDQASAELFALPSARGCVVTAIVGGLPAEKAGLKKFDVLRALNGKPIADHAALANAATAITSSERISLEVWRDGKTQTVEISLPAAPTVSVNPHSDGSKTVGGWIGIYVSNFRDNVQITYTIPGGPAARAGLRRGDALASVDGVEVRETRDFISAIGSTSLGQKRKIDVVRGVERLTIEVTPEVRLTDAQILAQVRKLAEVGDHDAEFRLGVYYDQAFSMSEPDAEEANRWYRKAAEAGHPSAQNALGANLFTGNGIGKNLGDSVRWFQKAAEQGEPTAMRNLAWAYESGIGVDKNLPGARRWLEKALATGSLPLMIECAARYQGGLVFEKDEKRAAELYRTAAQRGDADAQYAWATCLKAGMGTPVDIEASFSWAKKSADGGSAQGMYFVGLMYVQGAGVAQNPEEALNYLRQAASLHHSGAQFLLGSAYYSGDGVKQDYQEAARWYRVAADNGDVDAYKALGMMSMLGRGVPQSDVRAFEWIRKAADAGDVDCQAQIAGRYFIGQGVKLDYGEALKWGQKAAQAGSAEAQLLLGGMALQGNGMARDVDTAIKWFKPAAAKGNADAQYYLGMIYYELPSSPANRDEGIKLLRQSADQNHEEAIEALKEIDSR